MSETEPYEGIKFQNGKGALVRDQLTSEEALQISINNEPYTVIMRSPGKELEMVTGLLYVENIYRANAPISFSKTIKNELGLITEVHLKIEPSLLGNGYLNSRTLLSVSSCGICGKRELGDIKVEGKKLDSKLTFSPTLIDKLLSKMRLQQNTFDHTGGSHACAAFDIEGNLLFISEDIGRHNAVDKTIGGLIRQNKLKQGYFLSVSGRLSYEIVTKAFMAKIPVLIAVSAPSSLAVDFAKELGITLFGFSRDGRTTCYANPERVQIENELSYV